MDSETNNWKFFWLIGMITALVAVNIYIYSNVLKGVKEEATQKEQPTPKKLRCSGDSASFHPKWIKEYEKEDEQTKAKPSNQKASMLVAEKASTSTKVWLNDTSATSVFKRKIVKKAAEDIRKLNHEKGKIYCRLAVDREGNVVACKYIEDRSTIQKKQLGERIANYLSKFKFEAKQDAPELEYTGYSVTFK